MVDVVAGLLAIAGAVLMLLAAVGVLRFPDLYARMHAATKASTLGIGVVSVAAVLALAEGRPKVVLAAVVIFITGPSGAHFIGRAAYRAEGIELDLDAADDLAARLDAED